ncbi:MAG: succinate dehydrogenase, hydrophobic membrane anchor protein [Gammaproteobacteria bacterium]|nr:succinate dehydrogenase, hydrophobic membrane anchor protein [Gammaproteobacteria bacterium]
MGTLLWYFQRLTAVIILAYVLFILFSYMVKPWGSDYSIWYTDITSLPMKIFTTIFFISSVVHGIQGLRDVEGDYFTERTLGFMSETLGSYALLFRIIFRFFIALVVLVLTYILVFEYLLGG